MHLSKICLLARPAKALFTADSMSKHRKKGQKKEVSKSNLFLFTFLQGYQSISANFQKPPKNTQKRRGFHKKIPKNAEVFTHIVNSFKFIYIFDFLYRVSYSEVCLQIQQS